MGDKNTLKSSASSHLSSSKKDLNINIRDSKCGEKNEKLNDNKKKKNKNKNSNINNNNNNNNIEIKEINIENKNENNISIEIKENNNKVCGMFHVPYYSYSSSDSSQPNKPFPKLNLSQCKLCKSAFVPELLLSTTEPPSSLLSSVCFIYSILPLLFILFTLFIFTLSFIYKIFVYIFFIL